MNTYALPYVIVALLCAVLAEALAFHGQRIPQAKAGTGFLHASRAVRAVSWILTVFGCAVTISVGIIVAGGAR